MVPIITNGKKGFDEKSLEKHILEICKEHKANGRALAFAFIIYDFDDHTIPKILQDKTYWSALDKISGKDLSIFYINSQDDYYNQRQIEIEIDYKRKTKTSTVPENAFACLVPITPDPLLKINKSLNLKKLFGIDENLETPMVIFFQVDDTFHVSDSIIVGLKKDKLEDAFLELRNHIEKAVKALKNVLPENYDNHQEIFNLIKAELNSGLFYTFLYDKIGKKITPGLLITLARLFGSWMT